MRCPVCMKTEYIKPIGEHYLCERNLSTPEDSGCGTQFIVEYDYNASTQFLNGKSVTTVTRDIFFPYSVIFKKRNKDSFYKYDYLRIKPPSELMNNE